MGDLLLMDFFVIHAGMPFVPRCKSLRGHLYWAQVAGRNDEQASEHTVFVWDTTHKLYPGWRFISDDRRRFEFE